MSKNSILKWISGVGVLTVLITSYFVFAGYSATSTSTKILLRTSQELAQRWQMVSAALGIELSTTKKGQLSPVIDKKYSALDLVIYGEQIVAPKYKESFKSMQIPTMIGKLFIKQHKEELLYSVSGYRLVSIEYEKENNKIVSFYADVPRTEVDAMNKAIDGTGIVESGDNIGTVRYAKLDNGKYILGVFLDPVNI